MATRNNVEGRVYSAKWTRNNDGFEISIKGYKDLKAWGNSYEESEERIHCLILERLGDGEACLEYDKPLPKSEIQAKYSDPEIIRVYSNQSVNLTIDSSKRIHRKDYQALAKEYFDGGICPNCEMPLGERNHKPVELVNNVRDAIAFSRIGGYNFQIYSESFTEALMRYNPDLRLLPVITTKDQKLKYFEIAGSPQAYYIGNNRFKPSGWKCPDCSKTTFGYWIKELSFIRSFIPYVKAVSNADRFFLSGDSSGVELCTSQPVWEKFSKLIKKKGLLTSPIGVIKNPKEIEVTPDLELHYKDWTIDFSKELRKLSE